MKRLFCVPPRFVIVASLLVAPFLSASGDDISSAELAQLMQKLTDVKDQIAALRQELHGDREGGQNFASATGTGFHVADNILISGEAGAAFFDTGRNGTFPNNEFRIDEAKLFLDAKVLENVFFFTELNLASREVQNDSVQIGETYVELEDVQNLWNGKPPLALRAGRFYIPFGEEYLSRNAVDNPFISHTLADIWGVDEGVELFGSAGIFDYTAAVQNGSYLRWRDGNQDKALVARVGAEPVKNLRFSASAMRTGDLDVQKDQLAEMWFGNSYLSPVGAASNTTAFHADVAQFDGRYHWDGGHVAASVGAIYYNDNDSAGDNTRRADFWSAEAEQTVVDRWYAGVRYSQIHSESGFSVPGEASQPGPAWYTDVENIWRISAVVGYRWNDHLVWKSEYSWERGRRHNRSSIEGQDLVSSEIACGF